MPAERKVIQILRKWDISLIKGDDLRIGTKENFSLFFYLWLVLRYITSKIRQEMTLL